MHICTVTMEFPDCRATPPTLHPDLFSPNAIVDQPSLHFHFGSLQSLDTKRQGTMEQKITNYYGPSVARSGSNGTSNKMTHGRCRGTIVKLEYGSFHHERYAFIRPIGGTSMSDDLYAPAEGWSHLAGSNELKQGATVTYNKRRVQKKGTTREYQALGIQIDSRGGRGGGNESSDVNVDSRDDSRVNQSRPLQGSMQEGGARSDGKRVDNSPTAPYKVIPCNNEHLNRELVNKVFTSSSTLPSAFARTLEGGSVQLEASGRFVVKGNVASMPRLTETLKRSDREGWYEWLKGGWGWALSPTLTTTDKKDYINYHRKLHEVYESQMTLLRKKHANGTEMSNACNALYYKFTPTETQQRQNTERLWAKALDKGNLQTAVAKVRPLLEVIKFLKRQWVNVPWLINCKENERSRRWKRVTYHAHTLLRSSDYGPDVPVHWAAHPPRNSYPRSVVTHETMSELVISLATILGNLFFDSVKPLVTLDDVDAFLSPALSKLKHKEVEEITTAMQKTTIDDDDDEVVEVDKFGRARVLG